MSLYEPLVDALAAIESANSQDHVEDIRIKYLGREGIITADLRKISGLPTEERGAKGKIYNEAQARIQKALGLAKKRIQDKSLEEELSTPTLDVTAPVVVQTDFGHAHPVLTMIDDIVRIFWQMGYEVVDGPEIETEWYNFDALNMPSDHPGRDLQDTFYLEGGNLPRTQTSNVQIRYMENHQPPIRMISPGKVYRNEDEDARHLWMFHQVEGLVVDKGITLADLKGTLLAMMQGLLGSDTQIKLLPNYFPFTEPSVELHATCPSCKGVGCRMCSGTGWLELGGAGMVHPQVLRNGGIDPTIYSGFAFGFGPERIAAIRHDVSDVREFWRPNANFLEQF